MINDTSLHIRTSTVAFGMKSIYLEASYSGTAYMLVIKSSKTVASWRDGLGKMQL